MKDAMVAIEVEARQMKSGFTELIGKSIFVVGGCPLGISLRFGESVLQQRKLPPLGY